MTMWMVRAGRGGENVDEFLQKSVVALGWPHVGKLVEGHADTEGTDSSNMIMSPRRAQAVRRC